MTQRDGEPEGAQGEEPSGPEYWLVRVGRFLGNLLLAAFVGSPLVVGALVVVPVA